MEENNNLVKKESKAWAITSLSTGIIGLLLFLMPYLGLPLSIFAIVSNSKQKKIKENGMGTAGFVLGILGCIINGIMLVIVGFALLFMLGTGAI